MPTEHQPTTSTDTLSGMPERSEQEQQFRTIAVKVQESVHTQLSFIAQLAGTSLSEEIRNAVEQRIATAQDDPALIAKAQEARDEIEREAAARSAAIAGFMGQTATAKTATRSRRATKTDNE